MGSCSPHTVIGVDEASGVEEVFVTESGSMVERGELVALGLGVQVGGIPKGVE